MNKGLEEIINTIKSLQVEIKSRYKAEVVGIMEHFSYISQNVTVIQSSPHYGGAENE